MFAIGGRAIIALDRVPFASWVGELVYVARLSLRGGAVAKASVNSARVAWIRPETGRSTHGQVEALVTQRGGPNPFELKIVGMSCV